MNEPRKLKMPWGPEAEANLRDLWGHSAEHEILAQGLALIHEEEHTHTLKNVTGPTFTPCPPDSADVEVITITVEEKPK